MKKIFLFVLISIGISSCSDDDNTGSTTALEDDWLLVYQYGGDPPPGEEPPGDISDQNIRYHFNGNILKVTKNGEPIGTEIKFTLTPEVDYYLFSYQDTEFDNVSISQVKFSSNNSIASFKAMNVDAGYTLQKIQ